MQDAKCVLCGENIWDGLPGMESELCRKHANAGKLWAARKAKQEADQPSCQCWKDGKGIITTTDGTCVCCGGRYRPVTEMLSGATSNPSDPGIRSTLPGDRLKPEKPLIPGMGHGEYKIPHDPNTIAVLTGDLMGPKLSEVERATRSGWTNLKGPCVVCGNPTNLMFDGKYRCPMCQNKPEPLPEKPPPLKILLCPFCGDPPETAKKENNLVVRCISELCVLYGQWVEVGKWNRRVSV